MKKSLAANALFSVVNRTINVLFPLISHMYISRVLMPEGVGAANYAQTTALYFVSFACLGIPTYGIRTVARQGEDGRALGKIFAELFSLNAISTTLSCLAYYLMVSLCAPFRAYRPLYWILGIQVILSYFNIDWLYQGREDYRFIALRSVSVKAASLAAMVLLVHSEKDLLLYGIVICIGGGGNYLLNVFHARSLVTPDFHGMDIRRHIRPVLVMFVSCTAVDLYSRVDITMLGSLCSESAVGYYSTAMRMVTAIVTAATAISTIFLPRLSRLYQEDRTEFVRLAGTGIRAVMFFSMPCFVGLEIVAPDLIEALFGEAFLPSVSVMRILALLIFIRSIGDVVCYQIVMSMGKEKLYMLAYIAAVAVNLGLNALLIPAFAQDGAAAASIVSELFVEIVLGIAVLRSVRLRIAPDFLLRLACACAVMAAAAAGTGALVHAGPWVRLLAQTAAGGSAYLLCSFFLKNEFVMLAADALRHRIRHH